MVLDLRDFKDVLRRSTDALGRFEKDGPVPISSAELIVELVDALRDTGPTELGVSAETYLEALRATERAVADARSPSRSQESAVRNAKSALKQVQKLMKEAARSARRLARADAATRARWARGGWMSVASSNLAESVAADSLAAAVAPSERVLLGKKVRWTRRRFVVATERRVFVADRDAGSSGVQPEFSARYGEIAGVATKLAYGGGDESPANRVTVRTAEADVEFVLNANDAGALVTLIKHRTEGRVRPDR